MLVATILMNTKNAKKWEIAKLELCNLASNCRKGCELGIALKRPIVFKLASGQQSRSNRPICKTLAARNKGSSSLFACDSVFTLKQIHVFC